MAQERTVTPEKQLLNLIETSHANTPGVLTRAARHHGMSFFSLTAWFGRGAFLKDSLDRRFKNSKTDFFSVRSVNTALIVLIVIFGVYASGSIYASIMSLRDISASGFTAAQIKEDVLPAKDTSILKNAVSYYIEKMRDRDIFKIGGIPTGEKTAARKTETSKILEETARLKLVGISWSKNPDAMIEDTAALRTFFVKRGQMIGRVKVEAIFKDKVVLSFEGEEAELR